MSQILDSLKRLAQERRRHEELVEVVTRPQQVVPAERKRFRRIAEVLGLDHRTVERVCSASTTAVEWCEWLEKLLSGERSDPPTKPIPSDILSWLMELRSKGFRDPAIERVVGGREYVARVVEDLGKKVEDEVLREVAVGRFKRAARNMAEILRELARIAKELGASAEGLAEELGRKVESILETRYKVSTGGDVVKAIAEEVKRVGSDRVGEDVVRVLAARVAKASPGEQRAVAEEVKRLGQGSGAEVGLVKEPYARI